MDTHRLWHVSVLVVTLLGAGALALLVLAPLAFDDLPEGLRRARPVLVGAVIAAAALLLAEWRWIH